MSETEHWTATAERVSHGDPLILGEDDRGDLWVPAKRSRGMGWCAARWDRRFNPWNPAHWPFWWRSRRTQRIAFLEIA